MRGWIILNIFFYNARNPSGKFSFILFQKESLHLYLQRSKYCISWNNFKNGFFFIFCKMLPHHLEHKLKQMLLSPVQYEIIVL